VFILGDNKTNYPTKDIEKIYKGDIFTRETKGFGDKIGTEIQALCEGLGISSAFNLNLYPWFWQCIENGVTELNGYRLDPDNPKFWHDLVKRIAYREGIGDIFAEDVPRAIEKLKLPELLKKAARIQFPLWGQPAHRQGRVYEAQPSPIWIHTSLHWAIDSRDPMASHHQSSFVSMWFPLHHEGKAGSSDVDFKKLLATYKKIFGTSKGMEPGFENIDEKTALTFWLDNRAQIKDSLLLCDWCFPRILRGFHTREELLAAEDYCGDIDAEAKMLSPLTGIDFTSADLDKAGDRIRNLDRALHIRNYNRSRKDDSSGEWVGEYPEKTDGTKWDMPLFNKILDSYYDKRGWDKKTGRPTRAKLEELGLKDVADGLAATGKLP
jgi:aldehyde:ferredoxin oxidoreductase